MEVLDLEQDGKIEFDEFKSFMLRANVNAIPDLSGKRESTGTMFSSSFYVVHLIVSIY
jgi:hypothetical protein